MQISTTALENSLVLSLIFKDTYDETTLLIGIYPRALGYWYMDVYNSFIQNT